MAASDAAMQCNANALCQCIGTIFNGDYVMSLTLRPAIDIIVNALNWSTFSNRLCKNQQSNLEPNCHISGDSQMMQNLSRAFFIGRVSINPDWHTKTPRRVCQALSRRRQSPVIEHVCGSRHVKGSGNDTTPDPNSQEPTLWHC